MDGCCKPGPIVFVRYFCWRTALWAVLLCYFFDVRVYCKGLRDLAAFASWT